MNREKIIEQRGYSVQINISKEQLENFEIKVPKLIEQQSIIDIIEPKEKLFLKYHELIDITDIDNFHKTWNNLIDIIEPFEIKIQNIKKKINSIERLIEFDYKQFKNNDSKIEYFPSFQGFAFKSNDLNNRGKYKIFKITNINNDNTKDFFNILYENVLLNIGDVVTGLSGTIGTAKIIVDSDWLLNQRLLCIRSNIPLIIKKVIEHNSKLLLNNSTGSVQKNITKKDVLSLTFDKKMISEKNIMLSKLYINYLQQINIIELIIRQLLNIYIL